MTSRTGHIGKNELLSRIRTSRDNVAMLLDAIPPSLLLQPDAIGRWSVRDLLAHFVAHEQRALAEIAGAWRSERLEIDPNGASEFNAGAASAWAPLQPAEALGACRRNNDRPKKWDGHPIRARFCARFRAPRNAELARSGMVGSSNVYFSHFSDRLLARTIHERARADRAGAGGMGPGERAPG